MGEVMTRDLLSIKLSAPLSVVHQIMTEKGVGRPPVEEGNQVIGVITSKKMLARMDEYVDKISAQLSRLQARRV